MAGGIGFGTVLGLLSKENAVLMPFLAYAIHLAFFPVVALERRTRRTLKWFHLVFVGLALLIGLAGLGWLWPSFVLGFEQGRDFTMGERLMTQPRVLFLYLSLPGIP